MRRAVKESSASGPYLKTKICLQPPWPSLSPRVWADSLSATTCCFAHASQSSDTAQPIRRGGGPVTRPSKTCSRRFTNQQSANAILALQVRMFQQAMAILLDLTKGPGLAGQANAEASQTGLVTDPRTTSFLASLVQAQAVAGAGEQGSVAAKLKPAARLGVGKPAYSLSQLVKFMLLPLACKSTRGRAFSSP